MASTKKEKDKSNEGRRGCEEIGMLALCWWEYKLEQPLWKTVWFLILLN